MKSSTLILCLAVWSISLTAAYYLGSHAGNVEPNHKISLPRSGRKNRFIHSQFLAAAVGGKIQ